MAFIWAVMSIDVQAYTEPFWQFCLANVLIARAPAESTLRRSLLHG